MRDRSLRAETVEMIKREILGVEVAPESPERPETPL